MSDDIIILKNLYYNLNYRILYKKISKDKLINTVYSSINKSKS